jgi:hypothetical protein
LKGAPKLKSEYDYRQVKHSRDYWRDRCAALEKAIKALPGACLACAHYSTAAGDGPCEGCDHNDGAECHFLFKESGGSEKGATQ